MKMTPILEVIKDISSKCPKIPSSQISNTGKFAVIDQGQAEVAGYQSDPKLVSSLTHPVIIFGDHTRAVKFIDSPFTVGADGVKVLAINEGWDPRFVYHYLCFREIPSAGYSRHFKFLKELFVPSLPLPKQRRIAETLDRMDALTARARAIEGLFDSVEQAVFARMFGDPTSQSNSAPLAILSELIDRDRPLTYGILKPGPDTPNGVPYIRVADIKGGRVVEGTVRRTTQAIALQYRRSTLQEGDLLMSIRGHVGRFAVVPKSLDGANITQDSARIAIPNPAMTTYVRAAMSSPGIQAWMSQRTKGVAVRGINLGDLRNLPIPVPSESQVVTFHRRSQSIQALATSSRARTQQLNELAGALKSRAFRGEL